MSLPITHLKGTNFDITPKLEVIIGQKFDSLERFIGGEENVTCDIELEKLTGKQSGNIFRTEVNLRVRGKLYRAEATLDQMEKAIDEVRDELQKELSRSRDRSKTLIKRGGAVIKNMMRFGR